MKAFIRNLASASLASLSLSSIVQAQSSMDAQQLIHASQLARIDCGRKKDVFVFREAHSTSPHGTTYICLSLREATHGLYHATDPARMDSATVPTVQPSLLSNPSLRNTAICKRPGVEISRYLLTDRQGRDRGAVSICVDGYVFEAYGTVNDILGSTAIISANGSINTDHSATYKFSARIDRPLLGKVPFHRSCESTPSREFTCR